MNLDPGVGKSARSDGKVRAFVQFRQNLFCFLDWRAQIGVRKQDVFTATG
jgi:hypothetical protein